MTLADAVVATGISKAELSRLENGQRRIHPEHALLLASAYGIDLNVFREILQYEPKMRLAKAQPQEKPATRIRIPVQTEAAFMERQSRDLAEHLELSIGISLSPETYGMKVGRTEAGVLLKEGSLIIADPNARTVLGDLALNALTLHPIFVALDRDGEGRLTGDSVIGRVVFPATAKVTDFHKIVLVLPAAHIFSL